MKLAQGNLNFSSNTLPASGTLTSAIIPIAQMLGYCVQIFWTGTPAGNFSIQGSTDDGYIDNTGTVRGVTNFVTVLNTTSAAGGAPGSLSENLDAQYYKWFQVVYVASSSTGIITTATFNAKG